MTVGETSAPELNRAILRSMGRSAVAILIAGFQIASPVSGQTGWQTSGSTVYVPPGTNVGIGTSTPRTISTLPNTGYGVPAVKMLGILDNWGGQDTPVTAVFAADDGARFMELSILSKNIGGPATFMRGRTGGTTDQFWVTNTGAGYFAGNVGIGTTSPQHKLSVNGTIGTKEVIVTNTGWADHVFKADYHLRPLHEVASFINQHHRLPDMPSQEDVEKQGFGLGAMHVKLLAKIEELTLHLIQADERNTRSQQQNHELREEIRAIRNRLRNVESHLSAASTPTCSQPEPTAAGLAR